MIFGTQNEGYDESDYESEDKICPDCGCKLIVIRFTDDALGNPRRFTEKSCSNQDCGWFRQY